MKFTNDANINMTSYKGSLTTTYGQLIQVFGEPDRGPNDLSLDKVTCEWALKFEDGTVATLYDWKTGYTPMGEYEWHIGGRNAEAVDHILSTYYAMFPLTKSNQRRFA
jgi:hypothetical protein